ncbi:hypothetical protein GGF31_002100 [Allomyces arbusculus]|nr:hypothetical protein GGF31_002100 [Allomyces arbusculus]
MTITLSAPPVAPGFTLSMSTKTVTAFQSPVVVVAPVAVPLVTVQSDRPRPARALVKYDVDITAAAVSLPSAPEMATTASFDPAVPAAIAVAVVGAAVAAAVVVQRRRRNGSANLRAGEAGYGMVAASGTRMDAETTVVAK